MTYKADADMLDSIISRHKISKETATLMRESLDRINVIEESSIFRYEHVAEFERKLPRLNELKEQASQSFRPFAKRHHTSLCAAMGVPMSDSLVLARESGNYGAVYELFGLTNAKAKRFGLAALYCAIDGKKNEVAPTYNTVFDRDSPWTYRNEAEHMEEYARYHFNSYVINHIGDARHNPFEHVIRVYEHGCADFIFMQTEQDGVRAEKLATFHPVSIPGKGNVIAVHMEGDENLLHYRRWGDPYFSIMPVKDRTGLKITGIADQRFIVQQY